MSGVKRAKKPDTSNVSIIVTLICILANSTFLISAKEQVPHDLSQEDFISHRHLERIKTPLIKTILVSGNKLVPEQAIRAKIPFKEGELFDKNKTAQTIRAIHLLGYFQNIQILTNNIGNGAISLHIKVTEKPRISRISYEGNKALSDEKLHEKLETKEIQALDEEELFYLARKIKKAYQEKNYHHVDVSGKFIPAEDDTQEALFTINEGVQSRVKQVKFKGNHCVPDKILRTKTFTREDWILGFFDRAGTYHPDAVMHDKFTIENFYQSNGYLAARVIDTEVNETDNGEIDITFTIEEGELYTISKVEAPGNDILNEQQVLRYIPIWPGQLYSRDLIRKTMERIRKLWGDYGYIYADVQPSIRPDEKTKTVELSFNSDIGQRIHVNRIHIIGNNKTRDKIIRRELLFDEDEPLTSSLMDESKKRVQLLGYFDPQDGVQWKIIKLDEENADLELLVKEVKTGNMHINMGIGAQGDAKSPTDSFSVGVGINDTNLMGYGIRYNLNGSYSAQDKTVNATIGDDWLFDRPLSGSLTGFARKTTYEDFNRTEQRPVEKIYGGSAFFGFRLPQFNFVNVGIAGGYEKIDFETNNKAKVIYTKDAALQTALQEQINRSFQSGNIAWVGGTISQDVRNHPLFPTSGYQWAFDTKIGIPHETNGLAFFKFGINANWYTPIIKEYNLVLQLHGFVGYIKRLNDQSIPYRELFHVGGPASVRGFKFGQIGPNLLGSSIGSTKSFLTSVELQFPISADGNMRGRVFYDGGAGWDTPDACKIPATLLQNNTFDFRHAIGFGLSLAQPTPVRVDWAFKLDRKKKRGENLSEVHISMSQAF